jgi:hypothetical protein
VAVFAIAPLAVLLLLGGVPVLAVRFVQIHAHERRPVRLTIIPSGSGQKSFEAAEYAHLEQDA